MIKVELNEKLEGADGYTVTASLVVEDDGTYHFQGDKDAFPTYLHALVPNPGGAGLRRVGFEEDPATWARHLHTVLRTGYLVPVITVDGEAEEQNV